MRKLYSLVVELDLAETIKSWTGLDQIKVKNLGSATSRLYTVRAVFKALDVRAAAKVFKENREINPTIFHAIFVINWVVVLNSHSSQVLLQRELIPTVKTTEAKSKIDSGYTEEE